jgi:hypothetical protein
VSVAASRPRVSTANVARERRQLPAVSFMEGGFYPETTATTATPAAENGYKVDLVRGLVEEGYAGVASAGIALWSGEAVTIRCRAMPRIIVEASPDSARAASQTTSSPPGR